MFGLSVFSCRTDQFPEAQSFNDNSKFQLTSKRISLDESKHKEKLIPELDMVETKMKTISKANVNGRVIDYANGVSIDTDHVTYIENGPNFHTYTFSLTRENALPTDPVENLVLIPATDGSYREILFSYNLTHQQKQTLLNGGLVDTNGKVTITELEQGTYNNGGLTNRISCGWDYSLGYTTCNGPDRHSNGEAIKENGGPCNATNPSVLVLVAVYKCYDINDNNPIGNDWWAGPGSGGGNGGGGEPCEDCPTENPPQPCEGNGVATQPVDPNTNIGEGGCEGIPTVIELPLPDRTTPCEKTKKLLEKPDVQTNVNTLKEQSKIKEGQPNFGEKAFEMNNDGTTTGVFDGEEHQVTLGSVMGKQGVYHNHTPDGIQMLSPPDITSMLTYALAQPIGNLSNGFVGMVGSEECSTCPGGHKYHDYIIRFSGTLQELGGFAFQNWDEKELTRTYSRSKNKLSENSNYANYKYGPLNSNGLEKLFFDTLKIMGLDGKVHLQRIEDNGTVQNITENNNGDITATPCP